MGEREFEGARRGVKGGRVEEGKKREGPCPPLLFHTNIIYKNKV